MVLFFEKALDIAKEVGCNGIEILEAYKYTEVVQKMVDMTEENSIIASRFDGRIEELLNKELTKNDLEYIAKMRKEINNLSYKVKNLMNKLEDFANLEREYYNKYFIELDDYLFNKQ